MKKLIVILSIIVLAGCKSKKVTQSEKTDEVVKLTLNQINSGQKNKAYELGKRVLMTCNTSKFKPFTTSEATTSVINNITIEKLSKTCTKYRQWYGTFKDLELAEVYQNTKDQTTIYRFKALYSKKVANKELRVFMNSENLVSAIKTSDWATTFSYNK
ncbi:hypothetical protein GCM10008015_13400 [Flavobacterium palustre]|uniref:Lipoprotein n=1 Tax=Flavobacterium palustre TaxID=1476463 RepID=A0ABQ1HEJ9_9FLAO|nr:hypothetical protein [Flavobacterium palustre]GGA74017.1 hypothetical protein GCM10008015_13400 [Flavobacterium palustre]